MNKTTKIAALTMGIVTLNAAVGTLGLEMVGTPDTLASFKLLTESLTPELIMYQTAIQWNGVTPTVMSGDGLNFLMQLPKPQAEITQ